MPTGSIIQRARRDTQRFVEGSFSVALILEPRYTNVVFVDGLSEPYTDGLGQLFTSTLIPSENRIIIQGLATRHRQTYDPDSGLPIVGKNNHCTFSEKTLNERGYATRNTKGDIIVKGWLVSWEDTTGINKYKIEEPEPDETLGLIKCMLGEYA
jgi:hypothetical protein